MNVPPSSWLQVLLVILAYFLLLNIARLIRRFVLAVGSRKTVETSRRFDLALIRILGQFIILIEPSFLLIVTVLIISINPIVYGTVVLFLYITLFASIKNYFIGRLLLFNGEIKENQKITLEAKTGYIVKLGKFSISLHTNNSIDYLPYDQLSTNGFAVVSGSDVGHFVEINLYPNTGAKMDINRLRSLLSTSPYLSPERIPLIETRDDGITVKLHLEDEKYLQELIPVLNSWGWSLAKSPEDQKRNKQTLV